MYDAPQPTTRASVDVELTLIQLLDSSDVQAPSLVGKSHAFTRIDVATRRLTLGRS